MFSRVVFFPCSPPSRRMKVCVCVFIVVFCFYDRWCGDSGSWEGRKTEVFTLMGEHSQVHGFLYSVRFSWARRLSVCPFRIHSWLANTVLDSPPALSQLLGGSSSPAKVSCETLAITTGLRPELYSCSSSSSWSSSMASIWVLGLTSLMGAESLPSTTSSLDISLFRCSKKRNVFTRYLRRA